MPMNFSKESIEGPQPAPDGWYTLILKDFKPAFTKDPNKPKSLNLNPIIEISDGTEHDGKRIFENLSTNGDYAQSIVLALIHATGVEANVEPDGTWNMPGDFDKMDTAPQSPELWKYMGPLTNKMFEAELYTDEWNGKKSNRVVQYKCNVPGCTVPHPTNLRRKNKA